MSLALSFHLIADMVKDSLGVESTTKTASPAASAELPSQTSAERPSPASASVSDPPAKTLPKTPVQQPAKTFEHPPAQPPKTPAKPASKTASKPAAKDTRAHARELLTADPDMSGADLARACGGSPGGYWRTLRTDVLEELRDSGAIPSVRSIGA